MNETEIKQRQVFVCFYTKCSGGILILKCYIMIKNISAMWNTVLILFYDILSRILSKTEHIYIYLCTNYYCTTVFYLL